MGMTVYLDQAFLVNALLDYGLLCVCGRLTEAVLRRRRTALAGALGGLYGAASLLPDLRFLGNPLWQIVFGGLMVLIAFGPERGFFRRTGVLALLGAAFCGIVAGLSGLFAAPGALTGRVYYPRTLGSLMLTGCGAWAGMLWALGRFRHKGGDTAEIRVRLRGREAAFSALRDTGNCLRDPISGEPVLVGEGSLLRELLPDLFPRAPDLRDPGAVLESLRPLAPGLRPRLIPYHTVGGGGMLLALRPEDVEIDGRSERMLLAFSPEPLGDGGCRGLLGGRI